MVVGHVVVNHVCFVVVVVVNVAAVVVVNDAKYQTCYSRHQIDHFN